MGLYGTRHNTKEKKVALLTIPSGADPDASSKRKRERKTHERVKPAKKTKSKETIESGGLSGNTETTTADDEQVKEIKKTHEPVKPAKKTRFKETIESGGLSGNTETTTVDDEQVKEIKKDLADGIIALRDQSKLPATTPPAFPSTGKKPASGPKLPSMKFDPLSPISPVLSPVLMRAATESAANKKDAIEQALLTPTAPVLSPVLMRAATESAATESAANKKDPIKHFSHNKMDLK